MDTRKIAAIIPARGGSKGLLRKNCRILGDKPLMAWAIEQAKLCGFIDRIVVSTDDEELADIALSYGAEVPFLRPPQLATDTVAVGAAVEHAVNFLNNETRLGIGIYFTLYPSHPFRTHAMFKAALSAIREQGCLSFMTVKRVETFPSRYVTLENGRIAPIAKSTTPPVHYRPMGLLCAQAVAPRGKRVCAYPVEDDVSLIDIDTMDDFRKARIAVDRGLYDFWK